MAQTITRTFPDGDYPSRLNLAYAAYQAACQDEQKNGPPSDLLAGEQSPADQLAAEYQALKAEAEADAAEKRRVVTLRAVGRQVWRDLKKKHPPRTEGDEDTVKGDRRATVNTDTVEDDLVHVSVVEPKFTSRAAFDEWADDLSEGEFQILVQTAWELVNVAQFDPKSLPPSQIRSVGEN
jgi:hypothetical protein